MILQSCLKYFKLLFFVFAFTSSTSIINAQSVSSFILNGRVNIDSGEATLSCLTNDTYYPLNISLLKTKISNGKFYFKRACPYPLGFRLLINVNGELKYVSDIFIVDPGPQSINCNIDSLREIPDITNRSMNELKNDYLSLSGSKTFNRDSILLKYTLEHSYSYIALWKLINEFSDGYETIYDSIYKHLSDSIKNTYSGIRLGKNLTTARMTAIGNHFPSLTLKDINNKTEVLKFSEQFTLVDFWFSHCPPCISQFDQLKNIYAKYKSKGFELIGISTDATEDISNWKRVLTKYALPWQQLLDQNGKEADRLSIMKAPTNFLIDKHGRVIAKDIELSQLDSLLSKNLYRVNLSGS